MKLGFIGMGNMATALCRGFIASNGIKGEEFLLLHQTEKSLKDMQMKSGLNALLLL